MAVAVAVAGERFKDQESRTKLSGVAVAGAGAEERVKKTYDKMDSSVKKRQFNKLKQVNYRT